MRNHSSPAVSALPFLLIIIFTAGCSGPKGLDTSGPLSPERVVEAVRARNAKLLTLSGSGSISVDTPDLSNTGNIQLKLKKPDSLGVDITGPFGIGIARGVFTSADFVYYSGYENVLVRGKTNAKNLRSILRIAIEFDQIRDFIAGMSFDRAPRDAEVKGELKAGLYQITYRGSDEIQEYEVHAAYESVTRFTRRSVSGEILEELRFKDFKRRSDLFIPTIISMSRPQSAENLTLVLDRFSLNETPIDFSFRYPKNVQEVNL